MRFAIFLFIFVLTNVHAKEVKIFKHNDGTGQYTKCEIKTLPGGICSYHCKTFYKTGALKSDLGKTHSQCSIAYKDLEKKIKQLKPISVNNRPKNNNVNPGLNYKPQNSSVLNSAACQRIARRVIGRKCRSLKITPPIKSCGLRCVDGKISK